MEEEVEKKKYSAGTIIFMIVVAIILILGCIGLFTRCTDNKEYYTCKHCGYKMESYWSYHDGYVCYSCEKKYYQSNKDKNKDGNVYIFNYYD